MLKMQKCYTSVFYIIGQGNKRDDNKATEALDMDNKATEPPHAPQEPIDLQKHLTVPPDSPNPFIQAVKAQTNP